MCFTDFSSKMQLSGLWRHRLQQLLRRSCRESWPPDLHLIMKSVERDKPIKTSAVRLSAPPAKSTGVIPSGLSSKVTHHAQADVKQENHIFINVIGSLCLKHLIRILCIKRFKTTRNIISVHYVQTFDWYCMLKKLFNLFPC